jgi:hypothetical protein
MEKVTDSDLINRCLEFAAEKFDDIHHPVLEKYHARLPEAKTEFKRHDNSDKLEHDMVEQALYCLMNWSQRPAEVQIVLRDTIPHHIQTLKVPLIYLEELIDSLFDVVEESIPANASAELTALNKLRQELLFTLDEASS